MLWSLGCAERLYEKAGAPDNPGFLECATIEDEDDDENSLPDEAFALSAATPICERSREDDYRRPCDYYRPTSG